MYYIILYKHESFGYYGEESTYHFTVSNLFNSRKDAEDFLLQEHMERKEDFYWKHSSLNNYTEARIEPITMQE